MLTLPVQVFESTLDHAVGTCGRLIVTTWRRRMSPEAVLGVRQRTEANLPPGIKGVLFLVVVEESAEAPSKDARHSLAELLHAHAEQIAGGAMVFEGSGFRAAMVRSVATSMALLARTQFSFKVFPSVSRAAAWLAPLSEAALTPEEVYEAAQQIRNAKPR